MQVRWVLVTAMEWCCFQLLIAEHWEVEQCFFSCSFSFLFAAHWPERHRRSMGWLLLGHLRSLLISCKSILLPCLRSILFSLLFPCVKLLFFVIPFLTCLKQVSCDQDAELLRVEHKVDAGNLWVFRSFFIDCSLVFDVCRYDGMCAHLCGRKWLVVWFPECEWHFVFASARWSISRTTRMLRVWASLESPSAVFFGKCSSLQNYDAQLGIGWLVSIECVNCKWRSFWIRLLPSLQGSGWILFRRTLESWLKKKQEKRLEIVFWQDNRSERNDYQQHGHAVLCEFCSSNHWLEDFCRSGVVLRRNDLHQFRRH